MLEEREQRLGFGGIPGRVIAVFAAIAQGPAHLRGIRLRPPAVQLREVEAAVHQDLHAARAAGLPGPSRVVDPDVDPLDQMRGEQHVVVAEEQHVAAGLRALAEAHPLLHQSLPGVVLGVRLAGDDELHRALGVGQDAQQPLGVVQQETRALIGGEAAREAQGQRLGVEHLLRLLDLRHRRGGDGELPANCSRA